MNVVCSFSPFNFILPIPKVRQQRVFQPKFNTLHRFTLRFPSQRLSCNENGRFPNESFSFPWKYEITCNIRFFYRPNSQVEHHPQNTLFGFILLTTGVKKTTKKP